MISMETLALLHSHHLAAITKRTFTVYLLRLLSSGLRRFKRKIHCLDWVILLNGWLTQLMKQPYMLYIVKECLHTSRVINIPNFQSIDFNCSFAQFEMRTFKTATTFWDSPFWPSKRVAVMSQVMSWWCHVLRKDKIAFPPKLLASMWLMFLFMKIIITFNIELMNIEFFA